MGSLYRLSDGPGSPSDADHFQPPFPGEYDQSPQTWANLKKWWRTNIMGKVEPETPSGYLTLIPLNDSRLKPRRTTLLVVLLLIFALAAATATFLFVPRGVTVGEIDIHSDRMSWNTSKGTYQLNLLARLPIYNANYMQVKVAGKLSIYFFDREAGSQEIPRTAIPARSSPHMMEVVVDASNVPSEYALTILSECAAFPRRLVFFLKGAFTASVMAQNLTISPTDTYFMISCLNGGKVVPTPGRSPSPPPPGRPRQRDELGWQPAPLVYSSDSSEAGLEAAGQP